MPEIVLALVLPGLVLIAGVPAHPLLVHAVVVLVPLAALGAVAVAVRPSWMRAYGLLVALAALGGAVSAVLARIAGQQLEVAIRVTPEFAPVIDNHEQLGTWLVLASWPFAVLAVLAAVLDRRMTGRSGGAHAAGGTTLTVPIAVRVVGVLSALAGLVAVGLTILAGHSGAAAVWGGYGG